MWLGERCPHLSSGICGRSGFAPLSPSLVSSPRFWGVPLTSRDTVGAARVLGSGASCKGTGGTGNPSHSQEGGDTQGIPSCMELGSPQGLLLQGAKRGAARNRGPGGVPLTRAGGLPGHPQTPTPRMGQGGGPRGCLLQGTGGFQQTAAGRGGGDIPGDPPPSSPNLPNSLSEEPLHVAELPPGELAELRGGAEKAAPPPGGPLGAPRPPRGAARGQRSRCGSRSRCRSRSLLRFVPPLLLRFSFVHPQTPAQPLRQLLRRHGARMAAPQPPRPAPPRSSPQPDAPCPPRTPPGMGESRCCAPLLGILPPHHACANAERGRDGGRGHLGALGSPPNLPRLPTGSV